MVLGPVRGQIWGVVKMEVDEVVKVFFRVLSECDLNDGGVGPGWGSMAKR